MSSPYYQVMGTESAPPTATPTAIEVHRRTLVVAPRRDAPFTGVADPGGRLRPLEFPMC